MTFLAALGPILSGIAGIAGALGSGSGGGQTTQKLNLGQLRRSAERHGFNPLTVLRNAPSGYMTTHHPSLSSAETIARALQAGISGFMETGVQQATAQRERQLLDAQLELIEAQTNRIRSAPRLVPGVRGGSMTSPANTAAAISGRQVPPLETPMGVPGFNAPADGSQVDQAQIDKLLPATVTPIGRNPRTGQPYTTSQPAGTPGMDALTEAGGEMTEAIEGARRTSITIQEQPDWIIDTGQEIARAWWEYQKRLTQRVTGTPDVGDPTGGKVVRPQPGQFDWTFGSEPPTQW